MVDWLSGKMADVLIGSGTVKEDDRDIYVYGMDVLLSTALNILCVLALGILMGRVLETLVFLLFFITLRSAAGGYHANTHFKCFLIMMAAYGVAMGSILLLPATVSAWVSPVAAAVSLTIFVALSPAPHENRPVTPKEFKKFRKLSLFLASADAAAVLTLLILNATALALAGALGMVASAGSVLAVYAVARLNHQ